jgi:transposase-like protein
MGTKMNVASDKSEIVAKLPRACTDEVAAIAFMEEQRGWAAKPICPRCESENVYRMGTTSERPLWRCRACNRQYTVRIGTVFEDSRIPLRHWCYAFWRACSSKKGASALEIKRHTGLTYKSALFLMHRVRFAMMDDSNDSPKLTGTVEVDETYVGGKARGPKRGKQYWNARKMQVVALVQREGPIKTVTRPFGQQRVTAKTVKDIIRENVDPSATIYTDEWKGYRHLDREFPGHETVNHGSREYVRGNVHTNTVENFFGLLKRGLYGTFHSVSRKHLHRYVGEFAFRYNTRKMEDGERTREAIVRAQGKRLVYKAPLSTPLTGPAASAS